MRNKLKEIENRVNSLFEEAELYYSNLKTNKTRRKKVKVLVLSLYLDMYPKKDIKVFASNHLRYKNEGGVEYDYWCTTERTRALKNGTLEHLALIDFIHLIEKTHA